MSAKNFIGQRFGRLVVLAKVHGVKHGNKSLWRCKCDCGKTIDTLITYLTRKKYPTKSCGCLKESLRQGELIRCRECGGNYDRSEFYVKHKKFDTRQTICKSCFRKKEKSRGLLYRAENKLKVLEAYGGKPPRCACCGETRIPFLTVDHINNDGSAHRKQLGNKQIYRWLIRHNFPSGFQVLCWNCNITKGMFGKCPHTEDDALITNRVFDNAILYISKARKVLHTEVFSRIVECISTKMTWVTGVGKAAIIARKMAVTLASNRRPAAVLDAGDAFHGDIGAVHKDDGILAFSNSGKTEEILRILIYAKEVGITTMLITGNEDSILYREADYAINYAHVTEACPLGLTPTTSCMIMMVVADAIAMAVQERLDLSYEEYAESHHLGYLGQLAKLRDCER